MLSGDPPVDIPTVLTFWDENPVLYDWQHRNSKHKMMRVLEPLANDFMLSAGGTRVATSSVLHLRVAPVSVSTPQYSVYPSDWKTDTQYRPAAKPAKEYPFTLDPFQKQAIEYIERNESVLVSAHTSAGKVCAYHRAVPKVGVLRFTSPSPKSYPARGLPLP